MSEYRIWVRVPALPASDDRAGGLLTVLEDEHGDLGPVLSGEEQDTLVVLATEASSEAEAAGLAFGAVVEALGAARLSDHYPTTVRVEDVTEELERERESAPA